MSKVLTNKNFEQNAAKFIHQLSLLQSTKELGKTQKFFKGDAPNTKDFGVRDSKIFLLLQKHFNICR